MSTCYDGAPSGFTGTHYGGDGIGKLGADALTETEAGDLGAGLIQSSVTVDAAKEYRLVIVIGFAGLSVAENGSGTSTAQGVATLRLYEDGIEL